MWVGIKMTKENLYLTFSSWVKHNAFKGLKNCKNIIYWTGHYSLNNMDDVTGWKYGKILLVHMAKYIGKKDCVKTSQSISVETILGLDDEKIYLLFWSITCMNT